MNFNRENLQQQNLQQKIKPVKLNLKLIKPVNLQQNLQQNELEIKPVKLNLQQHIWLEIIVLDHKQQLNLKQNELEI